MLTIEYGLNLRVEWVPSSSNKADSLTRVQQNWLTSDQSNVCVWLAFALSRCVKVTINITLV